MKSTSWKRGRVYYVPKRVLSDDDVLALEAGGEVALLAFRKDNWGTPSLRLMNRPGTEATARQLRRWEAAQDARVTGAEFLEALNELGLRVLEDQRGYFHVIRTPESRSHAGEWAVRPGQPRLSRRKNWRQGA